MQDTFDRLRLWVAGGRSNYYQYRDDGPYSGIKNFSDVLFLSGSKRFIIWRMASRLLFQLGP